MTLPESAPPRIAEQGLTLRQLEVARLITLGLSNDEIAKRLFVTEKSIKFHITNIYKKTSVRSRSEFITRFLPSLTHEVNQAEVARLRTRIAELERLLGQRVFEAREKFADVLPLGRR